MLSSTPSPTLVASTSIVIQQMPIIPLHIPCWCMRLVADTKATDGPCTAGHLSHIPLSRHKLPCDLRQDAKLDMISSFHLDDPEPRSDC